MARWQRDPTARRRLAILLVAAEVAALTACFFLVFGPYLHRLLLLLGMTISGGVRTAYYAACAAAALAVLVGAVVVGVKYLKGVAWTRRVFITANVVVLALGLIWLIKHELSPGARTDNTAAWAGLLLPMITLFPLLWPLMTFRPVEEDRGGAPPEAAP